MNEKGRQTKLLAAIAVLAMVVCVFAIALPTSESNAAAVSAEETSTLANLTAPPEVLVAGNYVITGDVEVNLVASAAITFYVADGAKLTLNGIAGAGNITIQAADSTGTKILTGDSTLAINALTAGSVVITTDYGSYSPTTALSSSIYLSSEGASAITATTIAGTASDSDPVGVGSIVVGPLVSTVEPTGVDFGISIEANSTYTYFAPGMNAGEISLDADEEVVTVINGSATVTSQPADDTRVPNTIAFSNVKDSAEAGVTVTCDSDMGLTIGGTSTEGIVAVTSGTATIATASVDGVNGLKGIGTIDSDNTILYSTISAAVAANTVGDVVTAFAMTIYGDYSTGAEDIDMVNHTGGEVSGVGLTFAAGSSYTGTIDAGETSVGVVITELNTAATITYTVPDMNDVNATVVDTAGSFVMSGGSAKMSGVSGSGGYVIGSDIVISNISNDTIGNNASGVAQYNSITLGVVAFETMTLDSPITVGDKSVLPYGNTLTFENSTAIITTTNFYVLGDLRGSANNVINATGTVYALDPTAVGYYTESTIADVGNTVVTLTYDGTQTSAEAIIEALQKAVPGSAYMITGAAADSTYTLYLWGEIELDDVTIYLSTEGDVTVDYPVKVVIGRPASVIGVVTNNSPGTAWTGEYATAANASVTLDNVTIYGNDTANTGITVNARSALNTTNSLMYVMVTGATGSSVNLNNGEASYTETTSNVSVGAGMTLTLNGNVRNLVNVFGDLVINESATIDNRRTMTVYPGASVTINGDMTILGTAVFQAGSEGTVNGTVTVGNTSGGALLNVDGDFTIASDGTVTVTGVNSDVANKNRLNTPNSAYTLDANTGVGEYPYMFVVEGTLSANGMLAGYIHDQGSVVINGFADTNTAATSNAAPNFATIVLYDGVNITVDSFKGMLTITDQGIVDELITAPSVMHVSDNNIALNSVMGITITTAVNDVPWTSDGIGHVDYYTVMTISGNPGAVSGESNQRITVGAADTTAVGQYGEYSAYTTVSAETQMAFGANVGLTVSGHLVVDGTIQFLDQSVGNTADTKKLSGSGSSAVIDVNGEIAVSDGFYTYSGKMNAVKYTVVVTAPNASITDYYVSFPAAVAAENPYQDTITVMGDVTVGEDVTVPAGMKVVMDTNAKLKVASTTELILTNGASMTGPNNSLIEVDGIFTAQNAVNMQVNNVIAEVIIENAPAKTWTSLAGAIEMGVTDITANGEINIDEDLTIPEGTTVDTEYDVNVNDEAILTVEGELNIDDADLNISPDADVIVPGIVSIVNLDVAEPAGISDIDGAHYAIEDGAYVTHYVSSLGIASEKTNKTTSLVNNTISIVGTVAADNVTFVSASATAPIVIDLSGVAADEDNKIEAHPAILSVGTITFEGTVSIIVGAYPDEMFTGTIVAPCGDGETDAGITLTRASGFTVSSTSEPGVTYTYYVRMFSTTVGTETLDVTGTVAVDEGTVTLGILTLGDDAVFTVDSEATVTIPSDGYLTTTDGEATVDGTMNVQATAGITGDITVNGTMNATYRGIFNPNGVITVNGVLNIGENTTMTVDQRLIVGTPAETLGIGGTLSGSYNITAIGGAGILAYAGADLTGAKINWNSALSQSDAQSTVYYINETEYATVYANGGVDINGIFGYVPEDANPNGLISIEIVGYDNAIYNNNGTIVTVATPYTWYTADGQKVSTNKIGTPGEVYLTFDLAQVTGAISKDAGIILTIDDLVIGYGNGDVSQTVQYALSVGTHTIAWSERTGYNIENVTVTFNGQAVENGGTITITADMTDYTIVAQGAVPGAAPGGDSGSSTASDDGMGLTDYLLIVLVILIVVMAIIVAVRLMRS